MSKPVPANCARRSATRSSTTAAPTSSRLATSGAGSKCRGWRWAMAVSRSMCWPISAGRRARSTRKKPSSWPFDHFWNGAHYHYGPRNKNHRIYWDRTLVEDPLAWTLEQFEKGKLPAMIERAGYPGVAADLDVEKIAAVFPAMKKQALAMWEQGRRLTGRP